MLLGCCRYHLKIQPPFQGGNIGWVPFPGLRPRALFHGAFRVGFRAESPMKQSPALQGRGPVVPENRGLKDRRKFADHWALPLLEIVSGKRRCRLLCHSLQLSFLPISEFSVISG